MDASAAPLPSPGGGAPSPLGGDPSQDYMAAVHAMEEDPAAVLLEVAGLPTPGGRLLPQPHRGPQTEAQRWVEKLHSLYSSGAVVPLPFLRAVDAAPLTLLGLDRGGPAGQAGASAAAGAAGGQPELSWQEALAEVVAESGGAEEAGCDGSGAFQLLPEAVLAQVEGSPVLLNLATSLAHHKRLLAAAAAAQAAAGDGLLLRLRDALRAKADDLSTTLRTILCL